MHQKKVNGAPTITFSKDATQEVSKTPGFKESDGIVGYIQFQILKSHVDGKKGEALASQLVGFRSYLHYHVKATKAHLHYRMRNRVDMLLQVLNRANPDGNTAEMAIGMKNVANKDAKQAFRKF